jgi:hypothetical protein
VSGLLEDEASAKTPKIRKPAEVYEPPSKKTDQKSTPEKEGPSGRLVNITLANLNNQSLHKSTNSLASGFSSAKKITEDFMQKRDFTTERRRYQGK